MGWKNGDSGIPIGVNLIDYTGCTTGWYDQRGTFSTTNCFTNLPTYRTSGERTVIIKPIPYNTADTFAFSGLTNPGNVLGVIFYAADGGYVGVSDTTSAAATRTNAITAEGNTGKTISYILVTLSGYSSAMPGSTYIKRTA